MIRIQFIYPLSDVFISSSRANYLQRGGIGSEAQQVESDSISLPAVMRPGVNGKYFFTLKGHIRGIMVFIFFFHLSLYYLFVIERAFIIYSYIKSFVWLAADPMLILECFLLLFLSLIVNML